MNNLLYLNDTYLFSCSANVIGVEDDENGTYVLLDETIFYPQGGGQACDQGTLKTIEKEYFINSVKFIDGEVRHYGEVIELRSCIGSSVLMYVDQKRRMKNARSHTAGHLIQNILEDLDSNLKAIKGYHFPEGAYVEFTGVPSFQMDFYISEINKKIEENILDKKETLTRFLSEEEIINIKKHLPYDIPENKPIRVMSIGNFKSVPCGGTHVKNIEELNGLVINKIKNKNGVLKVSYSFKY